MRLTPTLACCLALASTANAIEGASFLTISPSAREISLGGASAISRGPQALFYNPAGAAESRDYGVALTHAEMFEQTRLEALAFSAPAFGRAKLGATVVSLTHGRIEATDDAGNSVGSFSASDIAAGLSWSQRVDRYAFGATAKWIRQSIANTSAVGYAAAVGVQSTLASPDLTLGASVTNLGSRMRFLEEAYSLPTSVNIGALYGFKRLIALHVGANHRVATGAIGGSMGMELHLGQGIALRSSYMAGERRALLDNMAFGVGWNLWSRRLQVDYAMVPGTRELEATHRMSLSFQWAGAQ
jgi:hypothetical protein